MRKLGIMTLCVLMMALTACSGGKEISPKEVVTSFLNAYQKKDEEQIRSLSEWKDYDVKALQIQDSDYIDGVDKSLQKEVYEMMMDFDHKELSEKINEDAATVEVEMTIYNFNAAAEEGMKEATKKIEELSKQEDVSDAQVQNEITKILFANMKKAKKDKKQKITINLKKDGKSWIVANDNADIQNLLIENSQAFESAGH